MEVEATDGYLPCKYQFNFPVIVWTFALLGDEDNSLLSYFIFLLIWSFQWHCIDVLKDRW